MHVHLEQCPACGSREVLDVHYKEEGHAEEVYVQCARCEALVAHYTLHTRYQLGRHAESFLHSAGPGSEESGRRLLSRMEDARLRAEEGFQRALAALKKDGDAP